MGAVVVEARPWTHGSKVNFVGGEQQVCERRSGRGWHGRTNSEKKGLATQYDGLQTLKEGKDEISNMKMTVPAGCSKKRKGAFLRLGGSSCLGSDFQRGIENEHEASGKAMISEKQIKEQKKGRRGKV